MKDAEVTLKVCQTVAQPKAGAKNEAVQNW